MYFVQENPTLQMMNQLSANAIPNVEALDPCKEWYLLNQVSLARLPRKEWISTQATCGARLQGPPVQTQTTCGNQLQDKLAHQLLRLERISTQTTCGTRLQGPLVHTQTTCGNQLQDKSVYTWVTYSNLL